MPRNSSGNRYFQRRSGRGTWRWQGRGRGQRGAPSTSSSSIQGQSQGQTRRLTVPGPNSAAHSAIESATADAKNDADAEGDADEEGDETTTTISSTGIILAITHAGQQLGAAAYDPALNKLMFLEDAPSAGCNLGFESDVLNHDASLQGLQDDAESGVSEVEVGASLSRNSCTDQTAESAPKHEIVSLILDKLQPTMVIASSRCSFEVIDTIKHSLFASAATLQIRPAREFDYHQGVAATVKHSSASDNMAAGIQLNPWHSERHKLLNTLSVIDFATVPLSTSCAGALLSNISTMLALETREDGSPHLTIDLIERIQLQDTLMLNTAARDGLSISSNGRLDSVKGSQGPLTLFGLLNTTRTAMSTSLLRRWFLFPSRNIKILTDRQDAVSVLSDHANSPITDGIIRHMKGMKNAPQLLHRLRAGDNDQPLWKGLLEFCLRALQIRACLADLPTDHPSLILHRLLRDLTHRELQAIVESIESTIDFQQGSGGGGGARSVGVKYAVDSHLDEMRDLYSGLPDLLRNISQRLAGEYSTTFERSTQINVAYFPQLGYLIALPLDSETELPDEIPVPSSWTLHFASESSAYWKSKEMRDLDEHLGDLHSLIVDREIEVVHDLSVHIIESGASLLARLSEQFAELDCLLCFAQAAKLYNYTRPHLREDQVLRIQAGRHPLQELFVDTFQPNDTILQGGCGLDTTDTQHRHHDQESVQILTGANGCGKSVYLKQVGLIVFMAQMGCFVPAESAEIGLVDQIFTRLHTQETVANGVQSSFMIDVSQVSYALNNCTSRSLILLDEFGKGTLSQDGASIFAATIWNILERGEECPRTLAATHFHQVFHPNILPTDDLPIRASHMEALLLGDGGDGDVDDNGEDGATLHFLFKVVPGHATTSHAAFCARACGISEDVIRRAEYVKTLADRHELETLQLEALGLLDDDGGGGGDEGESVRVHSATCAAARKKARMIHTAMRKFIEWDIEADLEYLQKESPDGKTLQDGLSVREKLRRVLLAVQDQ